MSAFKELFLAIQKQIKEQVEEIKTIDQDLGQLEGYKDRPAVDFPCVLIDFPTAQFQDLHGGVQFGNLQVSVRVGFEPWSSAESNAPDVSKEDALDYYDLEEAVFVALQGFTADGCIEPMTRISAATERREDMLRVREIMFTSAAEDDAAARPVNKKKARPVIEATTS